MAKIQYVKKEEPTIEKQEKVLLESSNITSETVEVSPVIQENVLIESSNTTTPQTPVIKKEEVVETNKGTNNTMADVKSIVLKLEKPSTIKFVMQNTGEEAPRIIHEARISLSRGTIYKLPITDIELNLQNSYVIRPSAKFADSVRILNVQNGFVTIEPIIHGIVLNNDDVIGCLI